MKDPQIRALLQQTELVKHIGDPHSAIVHELRLPVAGARIDIAVINGVFHGYEIKSASDTLKRLPDQLKAYALVFDYLTVVTEAKYQEKILKIAPDWVGVSICSETRGYTELLEIKQGGLNVERNSFYIAKLLCKEELVEALLKHQIRFRKSDRAWTMCEALASGLNIELLSSTVRELLKKRLGSRILSNKAIN